MPSTPPATRILGYASPQPHHRRPLDLRGPFLWIHALNLAIGLAWLWVVVYGDVLGFLAPPFAGASAVFQFYFFTLPGWVRILERSEMPLAGKLLAMLTVIPGTAISAVACFGGFDNWDWCC